MKSKPSKLDQFAEKLDEWELKKFTLDQIAGELHELGCDVSCSRLSNYLASRREQRLQEHLFTTIATGGRMQKELAAAYAKNPAPEIQQLIEVSKTLIMSLQVQGAANPEWLKLANAMQQTVLNYLSGETRAKLEARKIELSESKYRDQVAERKRSMQETLDKAKTTGGISEETLEKIERELKLL